MSAPRSPDGPERGDPSGAPPAPDTATVPASARWPLAELPRLLRALAPALGVSEVGEGAPRPLDDSPDVGLGADDDEVAARALDWLPLGAQGYGLEVEPLPARERARLPEPAAGEAVLLTDAARGRLVALLRGSAGRPMLLDRTGAWLPVTGEALHAFVAVAAASETARALGRRLSGLGLGALRTARVAGALSGARAEVAAAYRVAARVATLTGRLRARGARGLALRLVGGTLAQWLLVLLAITLLGRGALAGRLDGSWLWGFCLLLGSAALARGVAELAAADLGMLAGAIGREHLLAAMLRLDAESLRAQGSGQLLGRVLDIDVLEGLARGGAGMAALALVELALAAGVLALGAAAIPHLVLLGGVLAALGFGFLRYRGALAACVRERLSLTHALVEQMVGHRTRAVQGIPAAEAAADAVRLDAYEASCARADAILARLQALPPRGFVALALVLLAPAYAAGTSAAALAISLGGILLAFTALGHVAAVLAQGGLAWVTWQRMRELVRAPEPPPPRLPAGVPAPLRDGEPVLVARGLGYRYPGRSEPALREVALTIRAGERVLVQGDSGAGKSTLAALLGGLRAPDTGVLMVGGLDRHSLGAAAWRRRVALVPQFHDNHVFSGSLLYNLLLGRRWPPGPRDVEAAGQVCRALGLEELLARMPAGLQQMVGESGWQLSHGERSRVCLARALLQERDLRIFDESFAALDPHTARAILPDALARAGTVVVIGHL